MARSSPVETAPAPVHEDAAVAAPAFEPMYNVVLLDDDQHTYHYVVGMLCSVLGVGFEMAFLMARAVDSEGRVVVFTADRDAARGKRDEIKAYGPDPLLPQSTGSMHAVIEPLLR
jgi:ATP-dependent Clp protease adaptor protein ClpS